MERKKKIQDALDRLFSRDRREPPPPAPSEPARVRRDLFGTIPDDIPPNPPASAEPTPVPAPAPQTPPLPVQPAVIVPVVVEPVVTPAPVVQAAHALPAAAPAAAPSPAPRAVEPPAVPTPVIVQASTVPAAPPVPAPAPKPAEAKPVMTPKPAAAAPIPAEAKPTPPVRSAAPATPQAGGSVPESKPAQTAPEPATTQAGGPATTQAGGPAAISEAALNLKAEHHLVVFTLGSQYYGVDIAAVEGIIKMQPITIVPRTPGFVEGVTNLRGTVLPVFDLRKRFGLPRQEPTKDTRIVVIQLPGNTAGIIVDQVNEVLRIPEDAIEPPPPIAATTDTSYLMGIANVDNRFVILLDLSQVLTTEEKVMLPSVGRNPA